VCVSDGDHDSSIEFGQDGGDSVKQFHG
jgi:hypothetical protein